MKLLTPRNLVVAGVLSLGCTVAAIGAASGDQIDARGQREAARSPDDMFAILRASSTPSAEVDYVNRFATRTSAGSWIDPQQTRLAHDIDGRRLFVLAGPEHVCLMSRSPLGGAALSCSATETIRSGKMLVQTGVEGDNTVRVNALLPDRAHSVALADASGEKPLQVSNNVATATTNGQLRLAWSEDDGARRIQELIDPRRPATR